MSHPRTGPITAELPAPPSPTGQGPKDLWLIEPLAAAGVLTSSQAEELQSTERDSVWTEIVARGYAVDRQILETISIRFKVPVADLSGLDARVPDRSRWRPATTS